MDWLMAICLGVSLAAASGFRIFVPALVLSVAAQTGAVEELGITIAEDWAWVNSPWVTAMLAVATLAEIGAYYVPWIDNALDTIATPSAVIAGTVISAATMSDFPAPIQWTLAVVGGGGTAATVQGGTVLVRALSTGTTGGAGNPVVSTGEAVASVGISILAVIATVIAAILVLALVSWMIWKFLKRRRAKNAEAGTPEAAAA